MVNEKSWINLDIHIYVTLHVSCYSGFSPVGFIFLLIFKVFMSYLETTMWSDKDISLKMGINFKNID